MEVFIEYMVKRKKTAADYMKVMCVLFGGLLVIFLATVLLSPIPFVGSFVFLIVAGIIYFMYYLVTSINLEYEYILTDTELDVDKIINIRRRKRMTTVNIRGVDCFGRVSSPELKRYSENAKIKKLYACRDIRDDETKFVVFTSNEEVKLLFFDPNEKITDRIRTLNPQKTYID